MLDTGCYLLLHSHCWLEILEIFPHLFLWIHVLFCIWAITLLKLIFISSNFTRHLLLLAQSVVLFYCGPFGSWLGEEAAHTCVLMGKLQTSASLGRPGEKWLVSWTEVFPWGSGVKNLPAMQDLQEIQVQSGRLNLGSVRKIPLEGGNGNHSNILAWTIPWTVWSVGVTKSRTQTERLPLSLPVFLPGESHVQRSLVGCSPWGLKDSDMTEVTDMYKCKLSRSIVQIISFP